MSARGAWLEDLAWPEAAARLADGTVVVIPVGARAKEHGPHLPLSTDYRLARALGDRLAAALPVLLAPVVDFGYYPAFIRYPGSQHLSAATFIAVITDILAGFIDQGARRLAILNTGVSTEAPLRIAVRDVYAARQVRVAVADIARLAAATRPLLKQKLGGHADEHETSMMLAIDPALVRLERARADYGHALTSPETVFYQPAIFGADPAGGPDYSATGVRGDPTLADAAKGEAILAEMTRELVAGLTALFPETAAP